MSFQIYVESVPTNTFMTLQQAKTVAFALPLTKETPLRIYDTETQIWYIVVHTASGKDLVKDKKSTTRHYDI